MAMLQKHNHSVYKCTNSFQTNKSLIELSDAILMIVPCGIWSHFEMGYAQGINKRAIIYCIDNKSDLGIYRFTDFVTTSMYDVLYILMRWEKDINDKNN
jgi:hypothetical protein